MNWVIELLIEAPMQPPQCCLKLFTESLLVSEDIDTSFRSARQGMVAQHGWSREKSFQSGSALILYSLRPRHHRRYPHTVEKDQNQSEGNRETAQRTPHYRRVLIERSSLYEYDAFIYDERSELEHESVAAVMLLCKIEPLTG